MFYGFGRGRGIGRGGGRGFGFRGASPPWPYVGIGKGGLPRCGYFLRGAGTPITWPYRHQFYGQPTTSEYQPPEAQMTEKEELDYLRNQAEIAKEQLDKVDSRMRELESKHSK